MTVAVAAAAAALDAINLSYCSGKQSTNLVHYGVYQKFLTFFRWWQLVQEQEYFIATKAEPDKLIESYQRYADNSAKS